MSTLFQPTAISPDGPSQWFAVQTTAKHEAKVAQQLQQAAIEHFLPAIKERRRWSDRWKIVEFPLFSCYVFVAIAPCSRNVKTVLQVPGVLGILGRGAQYEPIPPDEIEALRRLVSLQPGPSQHSYLQSGDRVRIRGGALDGVEGILEQADGDQTLVVSIHMLRQAVSIRVNGYEIEPLRLSKATHFAVN